MHRLNDPVPVSEGLDHSVYHMHYSTGPGNFFFKAATGVEKRHASGKNGKKSRQKLFHF